MNFVFYRNIWRFENWLFKANGCLFFTGAFSCICQCNILFSDFLVIIGAGNAISTVSYDAGANWDISCMDIYQQSAVSTVFSAQKAAVDQRLPLD